MKISIVVPIYNVEKYLKRCIESLINQTYKDIEILLINDGSTDKSKMICEEYMEKDGRILVINKKNGGLSDARNEGIKYITGEYVLFVDSDDYIKKDTCEILYDIVCEKREVDLIFFGYNSIINGKIKGNNVKNEVIELSKNEVYKKYLYGEGICHSAWSKMYKYNIVKEIEFPKGKKAEDLATTYKYINIANKYIYTNQALYFYDRRDDSIMGKKSIELAMDIFEFTKQKYLFEKKEFPNFKKQSTSLYVNCILKTLVRLNEEEIKNDIVKCCESELEKINLKDIRLKSKVALIVYKAINLFR